MTTRTWTVIAVTVAVIVTATAGTMWLAVPGLRAESDTPAADGRAGWLGVLAVPVGEGVAGFLGIPAGLRVVEIDHESPARSTLIRGDTITAVDGVPVSGSGDLTRALLGIPPGANVALSIVRGGAPLEVGVTLAEPPPEDEHPAGLAAVQDVFDRALSGELVFEGRDGGLRTLAFVTGSVASVDAGSVTLSPVDGSPAESYTLSPNVWVWKDGAPLSTGQFAALVGMRAKVIWVDGVAEAVVAGVLFPPALEGLLGLLGAGDGISSLGALAEAFAGARANTAP